MRTRPRRGGTDRRGAALPPAPARGTQRARGRGAARGSRAAPELLPAWRPGARRGGRHLKNQYFGDVKDYVKYGLLRALARGGLSIGACWMLTDDDHGRDGRKLAYLDEPEAWRRHDPELFDALRDCVRGRRVRDIGEAAWLVPGASLHADRVPRDPGERRAWFRVMLTRFAGADLVFFDPDNGLEVPSCPRVRRRSTKHLYWDEVRGSFEAGKSVLVFQHFPRESHAGYVARRLGELSALTDGAATTAFVTPEVVFLLAARSAEDGRLRAGVARIAERWCDSPAHLEIRAAD